MSAGGHVAIQDIERISGVSRLEQWSGAGGTSLRLRTILDSGLVAAGAWAVIAPYTAQCEVRAISSYENRDLTVAALTYAHDPDTAIFVVDEPVLRAEWFTTLVAAINGTPDGFTLEIPTKAQTFTSWTTPTISSKSIVIRSEGNRKGILTGPNTTTDFINVGDAGNVRLENLYLKTWRDGVKLTNTGSKGTFVELSGVTFQGVEKALNGPNTSLGVTRLVVVDCWVINSSTGGNVRGIFCAAPMDEALIIGNHIDTVKNRGIELGENTYASQDNWKKIVVTGNHIANITGTTEAQAILLFGAYVNVSHNVIDTVLSDDGTDSEGIYTKCRYGNISNNTLKDAGRLDGFINIKGAVRSGSAAPQGHTVLVKDNTLIETRAQDSRGIHIANDDVIVSGNQFEGNFRYGITTAAIALNNLTIRDNEFTACVKANFWAIECLNNGEGLNIEGNKCYNLGDASSNPCLIRITPDAAGISRVRIRNNDAYDISGAASASNSGIYLVSTNSATISDVEIVGNTFDTVYNAVVFGSSDVSDVRVFDNKFANISGAVFTNLTSVDGYDVHNNQGYTPPANGIDFTNLDETPSVKNKNAFYRANYNAATNVTGFDDGVNGQRITVYFFTSNVTLIHAAATINLHGNTNYNVPSDSWMEFICRNGAWYELTRSND